MLLKYFGTRRPLHLIWKTEKHKITLSVQLVGHSKPHWKHLNSKSKQQVTLCRTFSSSKALNSLVFIDIHTCIRKLTQPST